MSSQRPAADSPVAPIEEGVADSGPSAKRAFTTQELFQERPEVLIQHGEETYRLRITKTGKLILNK